MPWFKVDDKLHDHRKARAAGPAAMGLWVLAGSWSADNLTDGFIPASLLPRWGRQREANRLTEVGLWHAAEQDGEKGWRFHEWAERQPTRAQKEAEREIKSEAGRVGGIKSGQSRREAKAKQGASALLELPSRPEPDPSRPLVPNGTSAAKRGSQLPTSWKPTTEHETRALAAGLILGREVDKFRAHAEEKRRLAVNWNAAFTRWLINAEDYATQARPAQRPSSSLPLARQIEEPPAGLDAQQYDAWFREQAAKHKANQ